MKLRLLAGVAAAALLSASGHAQSYRPGNLLVSRSVYQGYAALITPGATVLPGGGGATASNDGSYPGVFANERIDPSFGITAPIILDQLTRSGAVVGTQTLSGIVTSFPSKSELALNLSADRHSVTLMGYSASVNLLDVSNSNTPNHPDPTNPVQLTYRRSVATVDAHGQVSLQDVDAYSGNNGRAAITGTNGVTYLAGNAGNGTNQASTATLADQGANTGVQIVVPGNPETVSAGQYDVTQNGYAPDKTSKDSNFRGLTIHGNTLYTTKGSGGNGVDSVYQVGAAGALPTGGGNTISILPGFNTALAASYAAKANPTPPSRQFYPFGIYFANDTTLYVADEGAPNGATPNAGLEKWSLLDGVWREDYVLTNGLNLGQRYPVAGLDPSLYPATSGLRNLAGIGNPDGTVSLYAVTATTSAMADQGADPNMVVAITDDLSATSLPVAERFAVLEGPAYATVYRGVAEVPVPEPGTLALLGSGLAGLLATFGRGWRRGRPRVGQGAGGPRVRRSLGG